MRIFGYEITIRRISSNPLDSLKAEQVENLAQSYYLDGIGSKLRRIKAVRVLRPGTNLKDAKDWVELQEWPTG